MRLVKICLPFFFVYLAVGCASRLTYSTKTSLELLGLAEAFLEKKAYDDALYVYEELIERDLTPSQKKEAIFNTGQLALNLKKSRKAIFYLERFLEFFPNDSSIFDVKKKLSLAYMDIGDYKKAKDLLVLMESANDWLVYSYLYKCTKSLKEPFLDQIVYLANAINLASDPDDRKILKTYMDKEFADKDFSLYPELLSMAVSNVVKKAIAYEWFKNALRNHDGIQEELAKNASTAFKEDTLFSDELAMLKDGLLVNNMDEGQILRILRGKRRKIAVLLPLHGQYITLGDKSLKGALIAIGAVKGSFNAYNDFVEIEFIDTAYGLLYVEERLDHFARDPYASLIIGPIRSDIAIIAANKANLLKIPIILMAPRKGLANVGDYVFRNSINAKLQARTLVNYAITQRGDKRFVVLSPDDNFGDELSDAFSEALSGVGGEVLERVIYPNGFKDPSPFTISALAKNPDGIFIADYPYQGGVLIESIRQATDKNVLILVSSGFNDSTFARRARRYAEGIVFCSNYYKWDYRLEVIQFRKAYNIQFHDEPDLFSAQSFDSVRMAIEAISNCSSGQAGKDCIKNYLNSMRQFEGVCGPTRFGPYGDINKTLSLLTIKNGEVEMLKAAS